MKKTIVLFLMVSFGINVLFAQDGIFKFKNIEITFKNTQTANLRSIELYQNNTFKLQRGNAENCHYDHKTNSYKLAYSYKGIGGGKSDNRLKCPELYIKLNLITKDNIEYSHYIPLVFPICQNSQIRAINVTIDASELIDENSKIIVVNENNAYQIVAKEYFNITELIKIE